MPTPFAYEMYNSREYNDGRDTVDGVLHFVCHGTSDDAVAKATIKNAAPATYPGVTGLVRGVIATRTLGGLLFYGTVNYIPDGSPLYPPVGTPAPLGGIPAAPGLTTPLGPDYAFDLSAQVEHITQSIKTNQKIKRGGGAAPDNKRAIGITQDGEIKGCDRFKPYLEWSTARTFEYITMAYLDALSELVGTTNKELFYGHEPGTQMFLGASGNTKDLSRCVVAFKFAKQKHRTAIEICDGLIVPVKKAWEYLWVSYKNVDDANKLTQQPDAAYVEQIYEEGNYSKMGIG